MIRIEGLTKLFNRRNGVRDLTLTVPRGAIYGLLGHNGAGKSTTLGVVLGQCFPDRGSVRINSHDVFTERRAALSGVGAIFETPAFYDYLSGYRNLRTFCDYSGPVSRDRLDEVVHLVGLGTRIGDKVRAYSHGMRQRLALAQALLPGPEILILDEPADGLDPEGIHEMRELILRLNREWGLTILFSSHALQEVERVCTHIAVLRNSRLVFDGTWDEEPAGHWLRFRSDRQDEASRALLESGLASAVFDDGRVELNNGNTSGAINRWLVERGFEVHEIAPLRQTLEEFYLQTAQQTELAQKVDDIFDEEAAR